MGKMDIADRKLSKAEEDRLENLNRLQDLYESQGYRMERLTVSIADANMKAAIYGLVIILPLALLFAWHNGGFELPDLAGLITFIVATVILVPVHEGIHGLTWAAIAPRHFKAIQFGFIKEALTPYCTSVSPMSKGGYILGTLMPFFVLGIIPCIAAILLNSIVVFLVGAVMILGAGGDLAVVFTLLKHRSPGSETLCVDHPTEVGLVVFER